MFGGLTDAGATGSETATDGEFDSVSDRFVAIWLARAPGALAREGAGRDEPCYDCDQAISGGCRVSTSSVDCSVAMGCIRRHCVCSDNTCTEEDFPADMRQCVESCLAPDAGVCEAGWFAYMSCVVEACTESCVP